MFLLLVSQLSYYDCYLVIWIGFWCGNINLKWTVGTLCVVFLWCQFYDHSFAWQIVLILWTKCDVTQLQQFAMTFLCRVVDVEWTRCFFFVWVFQNTSFFIKGYDRYNMKYQVFKVMQDPVAGVLYFMTQYLYIKAKCFDKFIYIIR